MWRLHAIIDDKELPFDKLREQWWLSLLRHGYRACRSKLSSHVEAKNQKLSEHTAKNIIKLPVFAHSNENNNVDITANIIPAIVKILGTDW